MFRDILVPLDGSQLSEAALGPAAVFATAFGATLTLLHIIEQDPPAEVHHERHLTRPGEAEAYLKEVAARSFPPGMRVATHVHPAPVSDVPRSIVEHAAAEMQADLILMCTHGRGGVQRLLYGSVAQQAVAQGTTPLVLVKPDSPPFKPDRVLVPLDPDSGHDEALAVAESLGRAFAAAIDLLSVVPTLTTLPPEQAAAGSFLPGTAQAYLDLREENSVQHLLGHVEEFGQRGVVATAQIARGDTAPAILKAADELRADLILLSTHRKSGLQAFWARSVAPTVAQRATTPILLLPLA
jgi:nucleotide-binding universal stress UspA family protein